MKTKTVGLFCLFKHTEILSEDISLLIQHYSRKLHCAPSGKGSRIHTIKSKGPAFKMKVKEKDNGLQNILNSISIMNISCNFTIKKLLIIGL